MQPKFLQKEYKFQITKRFSSQHITAFMFGAAFAVGWTPCVGPILGAILTLAVTHPSSAFLLLLAYTFGLGIPFLLVGLFTNEAQHFIEKAGKWLYYINIIFGIFLIIIGIFVFTNQLGKIANFAFASNILISLDIGTVRLGDSINIVVPFLAGIVSFLSPCVLPIIPGFLTFLASSATKK